MLALKQFLDCSFLPEQEGRRLTCYLWPARRPDIPPEQARDIRKEFNDHCALCHQKRTELHHIVRVWEALLLYDGEHAIRENLIPLCVGTCHKKADDEELTRDFLHCLRMTPKACITDPLSNRSLLYRSTEFEKGIGRGEYSELGGKLRRAARNTIEGRAELLTQAASAKRRVASSGFREISRLLDEAKSLATDDETKARIFWEEAKIAGLSGQFTLAAARYRDCESATSDELWFKMARHSQEWVRLRKEAGGAPAPEVSFQTDCGITQFEKYRDDCASSLWGKKWYVYQLLDIGEYYAWLSKCKESIENLAQAGDWIDRLSMKELRPKLYQNLALAFQKGGDLWRCVLAASVSLQLFLEIGRQENKGLTVLIYLEVLRQLGLQSSPSFSCAAKEWVDPEMDNQWALPKIQKLR